jgi:hypothetical protein
MDQKNKKNKKNKKSNDDVTKIQAIAASLPAPKITKKRHIAQTQIDSKRSKDSIPKSTLITSGQLEPATTSKVPTLKEPGPSTSTMFKVIFFFFKQNS